MLSILTGSNHFVLKQSLKKVVDTFVGEHGDMALEQLDGEEASYERISEAVQSLPFLATKKLVILHQPGKNKEFIERVESLLANVPDATDVILVEPKLDKRSSYYKWLKKQKGFMEFAELDERGLAKWAVDYAKTLDGKLGLADAHYLIGRIGTNQQRLSNEIAKLCLSGPDISREVIDELTESTPQSKIFDLLDAAFAGQTKRALELYHEQRELRVEPQEIIAMLGWQLRQVALAKTAGTKHDLVREARMSPYSAKKAQRIASKLTLVKLKELVGSLTELDAKSKRAPIDLDSALQNYILHLA